MRIALLFPQYRAKIFSENLSTVDEGFLLGPPIILAYVAAILERHGHEVILVDARALKLSKHAAFERIKAFKPDMLGFRSETYHFHDSLEWITYMKSRLCIPVFTGGVNMTLYPEETMSHDVMDYGIIGEAVESLPAFLSAIENGKEFTGIPGVAYKRDKKVFLNKPSEKLIDFDDYPYPARHLLPNEKYHSFISQRKNFTVMLTSTGCPFKCSFCAIPIGYRARSPKSVLDEIELCYNKFNIREIDFFDAVLLMPKPRILEFCHRLKEKKFDLEWSCRSRVDIVDDEILKAASEAGCRQIYYGIESVDPDILKNINKRISPQKVRDVMRLTREHGIMALGFFMVGNPGDTEESVRETINFAKNLELDFIQVCRTIAKPGTSLDKEMIKTCGRDFWREHVSGKKITRRLPAPWSLLTHLKKTALTKEFYVKFYFRPRLIWERIKKLRSFFEFKKFFKAGFKMLLEKMPLYSSMITDTTEAEKALKESEKYIPAAQEEKVCVTIPAYDEKDNVGPLITAVLNVLPKAHILIVDDNSPDGTGNRAELIANDNPNIHVIRRKGPRGIGYAYIDGFKHALQNIDFDYLFQMDADFSHNPRYLPMLLHYAKEYDVVTGSRFLKRVSIRNRKFWPNFISITTKRLAAYLTGVPLTDLATGFKCFRKGAIEGLDFKNMISKSYAFQVEASFRLAKNGFTIKEVPIVFEERRYGKTKISWVNVVGGVFLVLRLLLMNEAKAKEKREK